MSHPSFEKTIRNVILQEALTKQRLVMPLQQFEFLPLDTNPQEASYNVILLHGYGADGFDMLHVANLWQESLTETSFYALQAPEPCQNVPGGRQWFHITDMNLHTLYKGAHQTSLYVEQALLHCVDHTHVPLNRTILMGFSQGAMMALYTALYRTPTIAGVLSYAGGLFAKSAPDRSALNMPLCLIHGDADTVVPLSLFQESTKQLKEDGLKPEIHILSNLDHTIDDRAFKIGRDFLQKVTQQSK